MPQMSLVTYLFIVRQIPQRNCRWLQPFLLTSVIRFCLFVLLLIFTIYFAFFNQWIWGGFGFLKRGFAYFFLAQKIYLRGPLELFLSILIRLKFQSLYPYRNHFWSKQMRTGCFSVVFLFCSNLNSVSRLETFWIPNKTAIKTQPLFCT